MNGDYRFAGGGITSAERHRDALARETRYQLRGERDLLGVTVELDIPRFGRGQLFRMVSFYNRCEIHAEKSMPALDRYEHELGFHPLWVTLKEALAHNELLIRSAAPEHILWLARETAVLRQFVSLFNDLIL